MTERTGAPFLFYILAGEASGDLLGARLMQAMKKEAQGPVIFKGVGGPRMRAEGLEMLFPGEDLGHVGLVEVLRHIPSLLNRMKKVIQAVVSDKPLAFITIDAPDFSFRVSRQIRARAPGIKLIHYVAPSVWAWRPGRAAKIAEFLDHLLALLPFEPPYFDQVGLPCTFVGHPLVESGAASGDGAAFRAHYALSADQPLLALLPGSRVSEIKRLMPVFKKTVLKLAQRFPRLALVLPVAPSVEKLVTEAVASWSVPVILARGDEEKYAALAASTAALACSGTISIELALARLPSVIAYKVNALTAFLAKRLIKTRYVTLINIMQDRPLMPEYLQDNCTPDKLAEAVGTFLADPARRQACAAELGRMAVWLGAGQFVPSEKAAQTVWAVLRGEKVKTT